MRDDDAVAHPDIVMMPRKKTATEEVHVERKVVDQTFAPLTEEEKQAFRSKNLQRGAPKRKPLSVNKTSSNIAAP